MVVFVDIMNYNTIVTIIYGAQSFLYEFIFIFFLCVVWLALLGGAVSSG